MKLLFRPCFSACLAVGLGVLGVLGTPANASLLAGSGTQGSSSAPQQSWTLADGTQIQASLENYSLQTRLLSFELPSGEIIQEPPSNLTALSKLKWLTSDAFLAAVENYRPPEGAALTVATRLGLPVLVLLTGVFFTFWAGIAIVSGERKLKPAAFAFLKSIFWAIAIVILTGIALRIVAESFGTSPIAPFFQTLLIGGGVLAIVGLASFQVGSGYGLSGGSGIGAVLLGGTITLITSVVTLYLIPRFLQRPGIDDWFTDHLLMPLGLA